MAGVTIERVAYWDNSTPPVLTTVSSTQYYYDASGNKVIIQSLPTTINSQMTAPIICEYTTAPNPLQTYPVIKQAGLLLFTHLYNNRSNTTDNQLKDIPFGVSTLLRPYKPLVM
ncbi:MAG: phage gp6-like head-tail connector protein [Betaproteobacteria bacterium]|nr:phage gp6-like head-tail connector protein [Betaproteobacteria bacterium]